MVRRAGWVLTVALAATLAVGVLPAGAQMVPDPETTLRGDLEHQILTTDTQDPTSIEVAGDGRVVFTERTGRLKIWHQDGTLVEAGRVAVDSRSGQCNDCEGSTLDEGGLHGVLLAGDFDESGHVYLYYSVPNSVGDPPSPPKHPDARGPAEAEGKFRLSRFTLVGDTLDMASEEPLLENPAYWFECCHYGGDMEWLADGTMLLSTGDDTISHFSNGYSPHDERPGMEFNNAALTSQNLADRRGKLLRLDVADVFGDGSLVPPDNPFVDDPGADPHVYALGLRSPYSFAVDPVTGAAFVGNVGPDGKWPDPRRGPAAHEELVVVPPGGGSNHGWPYCTADNVPYHRYDWSTGQAGEPFDCDGMTAAALYYSYNPSPTTSPWVQTGVGGTCMAIMGGEVYHGGDSGALRLPERFDNQLLWMEWCRGGLVSTPITEAGQLDTAVDQVKVVLQGMSSPIDATLGPDGAIYVAEYASRNYGNGNSRISRVICADCTPDPADYGGAAVTDPSASLTGASLDPTVGRTGSGWVPAALILAAALAYARRRRRFLP